MRKNLYLAMTLALAMGFASCSKDATDGTPDAQAKGKFTFVLPAERSVITYAGEVPANANEKKLDLGNTTIYMFDATNGLEAVLSGTELAPGTSTDGKKTLTIDVDGAWTGNKTFHIVGNTNQGAVANLATTAVLGVSEANFLKIVTASQGSTMISSADGLLMAGSVDVTNIEQAGSSDIELFRSVARFDIHNDVTANKVTISQINISQANLQGFVTAYGIDVTKGQASMATGDLNGIAVSTATAAGLTANGDDPTHNYQIQESLFYLYPTQLKVDGTGTVMTLVGKVAGGADQIYTLNKEASNLPTDCYIKANTRYIISAIDVITRTFVITIADWDEGDKLIGRPGTSGFGLVAAPAVTNGTFNAALSSIAVTDPTAAFSATFKVKGTSTKGVSAQVISTTGTGLAEVDGSIISATAVYDNVGVTYAVPYFGYDVEVKFAAAKVEAGKNFTTIVRLTDKGNGATVDVIIFHEGSTNVIDNGDGTATALYPTGAGYLKAVKLGSLYWAPVNVGATTDDATIMNTASLGYAFQRGRNIPFNIVLPNETCVGPLLWDDGLEERRFITTINPQNNWVDPSQDVEYKPICGARWEGIATISPCPVGWSLPTEANLNRLIPSKNANVSFVIEQSKNRVAFTENGNTLYLPLAGLLWC